MIHNSKCDECNIGEICQAKAKLKPFTEEARKDLGVTLDFLNCNNFILKEDIEEEIN